MQLAAIALGIRISTAMVIGVPMPGRELFALPAIQLPKFLVGIRLGGPVTSERLISAVSEGLLFAVIVIVFGLANAISIPTRLLKIMPKEIYGLGVATTLATSITPNLAASIQRIRQAQHL